MRNKKSAPNLYNLHHFRGRQQVSKKSFYRVAICEMALPNWHWHYSSLMHTHLRLKSRAKSDLIKLIKCVVVSYTMVCKQQEILSSAVHFITLLNVTTCYLRFELQHIDIEWHTRHLMLMFQQGYPEYESRSGCHN